MSYHHLNRFREHYAQKTLSVAARVIARDLASAIPKELGARPFGASRNYWADLSGLTHKTTDRALEELVTAGVFTVTKKGKRSPRVFALAVECPEGCSRLEEHNTPQELAARKLPELPLEEALELPTSEIELPTSLAAQLPTSLATNKQLINNSINQETERELVQLVRKLLAPHLAIAHPKTAHLDLMETLSEFPKLCEEHLAYLLERNQVKSPRNWFATVLENSAWKLLPDRSELTLSRAIGEREIQEKTAWESATKCPCGSPLAECLTCCYLPNTEEHWAGEAANYFHHLTDPEEIVRSCREWAAFRGQGFGSEVVRKIFEGRKVPQVQS